jgi:hypothetical protein
MKSEIAVFSVQYLRDLAGDFRRSLYVHDLLSGYVLISAAGSAVLWSAVSLDVRFVSPGCYVVVFDGAVWRACVAEWGEMYWQVLALPDAFVV